MAGTRRTEQEDWTRSHSQDPVGADTAQYAAAGTQDAHLTSLTIHITLPQSGSSETIRFLSSICFAIALYHFDGKDHLL